MSKVSSFFKKKASHKAKTQIYYRYKKNFFLHAYNQANWLQTTNMHIQKKKELVLYKINDWSQKSPPIHVSISKWNGTSGSLRLSATEKKMKGKLQRGLGFNELTLGRYLMGASPNGTLWALLCGRYCNGSFSYYIWNVNQFNWGSTRIGRVPHLKKEFSVIDYFGS